MRINLVLAAIVVCATVTTAAFAKPPSGAVNRLKALPNAAVLQDSKTGEVRFVAGRLAVGTPPGWELSAALGYLKQHRAAYGLTDPESEIRVRRLDVEPSGQRHLRLQQEHRGLPVYGSSMIAHFSAEGTLYAVNGSLITGLDVDPTPHLGSSEAVAVAEQDLGVTYELSDGPELTVFPWEDGQYLVWRLELFSDSPLGRWVYFVDAATGEVIYKADKIINVAAVGTGISVMGDARNHIDVDYSGGVYQMVDYTRRASYNPHGHDGQMAANASITTYIPAWEVATDADNVWDDPSQASSVDAHVYTGLVYDWLLDKFNRNGFDDYGSSMRIEVENSMHSDNASWSAGSVIVYKASAEWRSLAGCPDVIAHEWAHGVTEYSSMLAYEKESGALNESFSDMMGVAFEFAHDTLDTPDWLMGENGPLSGEPFRSLSDPNLYGDPDTYEGLYWYDFENCIPFIGNDYCGVHRNCTVGDKWFFLLSEGGSHNGVDVSGIGVQNAIDIAYRANTYYWTVHTTYSEAAYGTILAATDLDPSGVWAGRVEDAWDAVQVPLPSPGLAFAFPSGAPLIVAPGEESTFEVSIEGTYGGSLIAGSVALVYRIDGGDNQSAPATELSAGYYQATIPEINCGQSIEYAVEAYEETSGRILSADSDDWFLAAPGDAPVIIFDDDFESDLGWSRDSEWERGMPYGSGGTYGGPDPYGAYAGSYVYGYNLIGDYWSNLDERYLTSPALDCSEYSAVVIDFQRWLGVEQAPNDHASIRVSSDSSEWITVWENTDEVADYAWRPTSLNISSVAAGQPTVYIRFVMGPTNDYKQYSGWNIDDFRVTGCACYQEGPDGDGDGVLDDFDNCIAVSNPTQRDGDDDGVGDACDICDGHDDLTDSDSDGVPDGCDNCPYTPNPDQEDVNGDQVGDLCCCEGTVGDANGDGHAQPTIGDISAIIDLLFVTEKPLGCYQEADINRSAGGLNVTKADITVGDISYLIDYLFITGPENMTLFDCPQ